MILRVFALGFIVIAVFSLFQLSSIASTYREGTQAYNELTRFITRSPEPQTVESNPSEANVPNPPHEAASRFPEVDFDSLGVINPDIAAWLILEGTQINYPVVQGTDNSFYLNHMFDGTQSAVGSLFIDSSNAPEFADQNTIIHGHHMKDGSMFALLTAYQSQAFFDENPQVFLLTPDGNYLVELFAGYAAAVTDDSWRISFADDLDFEEWITAAKARSDFASDVELHPSDRVVTLSTCSYVFDNARYVLVGRLVPVE